MIDSVLLRPLPFPEPQQLLYANGKFALSDQAAVSPPDFQDYRSDAQSIRQFAAIGYLDGISNLTGSESVEQVHSQIVSWNFFDALGIPPEAVWHDVTGRPNHVYLAEPIRRLMA